MNLMILLIIQSHHFCWSGKQLIGERMQLAKYLIRTEKCTVIL